MKWRLDTFVICRLCLVCVCLCLLCDKTDKPRWFKDHTKEAYGFIGGTVNMTCSAVAEPGADFIWIKDNRTLQPNDDVEIFNSDHHSSLQLYIYDDSVFGDYECRATNMLGTMARVIVLEQATKPVAPSFKIKVPIEGKKIKDPFCSLITPLLVPSYLCRKGFQLKCYLRSKVSNL